MIMGDEEEVLAYDLFKAATNMKGQIDDWENDASFWPPMDKHLIGYPSTCIPFLVSIESEFKLFVATDCHGWKWPLSERLLRAQVTAPIWTDLL